MSKISSKKKPKAKKKERENLVRFFFFLVVHFASSGAHSRVFIMRLRSKLNQAPGNYAQRAPFLSFGGEREKSPSRNRLEKSNQRSREVGLSLRFLLAVVAAAAAAVAGATEVV